MTIKQNFDLFARDLGTNIWMTGKEINGKGVA